MTMTPSLCLVQIDHGVFLRRETPGITTNKLYSQTVDRTDFQNPIRT